VKLQKKWQKKLQTGNKNAHSFATQKKLTSGYTLGRLANLILSVRSRFDCCGFASSCSFAWSWFAYRFFCVQKTSYCCFRDS